MAAALSVIKCTLLSYAGIFAIIVLIELYDQFATHYLR